MGGGGWEETGKFIQWGARNAREKNKVTRKLNREKETCS